MGPNFKWPPWHHATMVVAFQWRHLIVQWLSLSWIDWIGHIIDGLQTTINSFFYFKTILSKIVYLLTLFCSQGEVLRTKVKKICDGFHAAVYPCPEVNFLPVS